MQGKKCQGSRARWQDGRFHFDCVEVRHLCNIQEEMPGMQLSQWICIPMRDFGQRLRETFCCCFWMNVYYWLPTLSINSNAFIHDFLAHILTHYHFLKCELYLLPVPMSLAALILSWVKSRCLATFLGGVITGGWFYSLTICVWNYYFFISVFSFSLIFILLFDRFRLWSNLPLYPASCFGGDIYTCTVETSPVELWAEITTSYFLIIVLLPYNSYFIHLSI